MKPTKAKTTGRNNSRLPSINNYTPYPLSEFDILDTDEDKVMMRYSKDIEETADILDTDEDIVMYYKGSFSRNQPKRIWRRRIA